MTEVTSYTKKEQLSRSPGVRCPSSGRLRSECNCRSCLNRRNRKAGLEAQRRDGRKLAKGLGREPGRLNNEETTNWPIRSEAKSGLVAKGVHKFYDLTKAQSDASTPIGSAYPFVAVADGLCVIRVDDFMLLLHEARRGSL